MAKHRTPFAKKSPDEVRTKVLRFLVTVEEDEKIRDSAEHRELELSEFLRRAALGRRADVAYDVQTVLVLSDITRTMRQMHSAFVSQGIAPPADAMLALIEDARAAMLRIDK